MTLAPGRAYPSENGRFAMRQTLAALVVLLTIASPALVANGQQDRLLDCDAQAAGRMGPARKAFMSACLTGEIPTYAPRKPKPCGKTYISPDEACHIQ